MKKRALIRIISILTAFALSLAVMVSAQDDPPVDYGEKLDTLVELFKTYHLDIDPDEDPVRRALIRLFEENPGTFEGFVNIMFQSYDPYSYYMDAEDYAESFPTANTTSGVGVTIGQKDDGCYITSVVSGSPAKSAGLLAGDKFLAVDGISAQDYSVTMIGDLLSGAQGTDVVITVLRGEEELTFTVKRAPIAQPNVTFSNLGDGVAYIKIAKIMGTTTFLQFCEYYESLPDAGFKSVVLDLRDNPGGDFDCMINIMDYIIPDKDMPYLVVRQSNPTRMTTYTSLGYGWDFNKMVILINENTASAAEVMAGALQSLGYAEIVGVPSMGKGLGQSHLQLEDGSYAIISSHQMILPFIGSFTGRGITPKHYTPLKVEPYVMPDFASLDFTRGIHHAMNKNTLGVEQRLKQMGYFEDTPDKTSDFKTFHAVNQFQKSRGLEQTRGYCDAATVTEIDRAMKEFAKRPVVTDTQLPKAVALAKNAAKSNTKPTPVKPQDVRFISEN